MEVEYFKWRCTTCREEPKHINVSPKGKVTKLGACVCKGARTLEMVPLTKRKYLARLS